MYEEFTVKWIYPLKVVLRDEKIIKTEFLREYTIGYRANVSEFSLRLKKDLELYFSGKKIDFSNYEVEIKRPFLSKVLKKVREIEYGKTTTYSEIAKELKTSPRAVGQALKANPAPVIIPCHRVVSKNGIGGFSQGLDIKFELLKLEKSKLK